jgi:GntP family gluconate:H+ symporter
LTASFGGIKGNPDLNLPLLALSIGSGSLFFNYANHAGFRLVKASFGMTLMEATKTISVGGCFNP